MSKPGKNFKIVNGDISDGYHTFDELYEHRCLLYLALCMQFPKQCGWRLDFEGWFLLYFQSPQGQISYHIPMKYLPEVSSKIEENLETKWDGHTSQDVIERLNGMLK